MRNQLRREAGQVLVFVCLALPVFLSLTALVVDGSGLFLERRADQNAADAVALALAQDIKLPAAECDGCYDDVLTEMNDHGLAYLERNHLDPATLDPAWHRCSDSAPAPSPAPVVDPGDASPPDRDTNCYAYPYIKNVEPAPAPSFSKVEVRLRTSVNGFFTRVVGLGDLFKVRARAVASAKQATAAVCDYTNPVDSPPNPCVIPGADAVQGTLQPAGDAHCDFSDADPPVDQPWDQYLPNDCVVPATDPVTGTHQPAQEAHCTFEPPVDNPDQYLTTDPPCTIPGTDPIQGTYVAAESAHCIFNPPVANPDQYLTTNPPCTIPGTPSVTGTYHAAVPASCEFKNGPPVDNPDQYLTTNPPCIGPVTGGLDGAMAFVMTRECDAISYTGAGGGTVGSLVTNGGILFSGNSPKKVATLGYDQAGCPNNPDRPPSGTGQCTDTSDNLCVKDLVDLGARVPMNWPLPPPPEPSPLSSGTTWNPSTDYPSSCIDLGTSSRTFTPGDGAPGIYCLRGGATLTLGGDFTTGDGYTFFALGGGRIAVSSNGTTVKFYWPSSCGARPAGRPASFACFGRTISGYDPQTLFYATSTVHDGSRCDLNAICINGQNSSLIGDMFAVGPAAVFPPPNRLP